MNTGIAYTLPTGIIFNTLVGLVFLIYWGMTFVIIYHLIRFGIGVQPKRFAAIFLLGSVILSVFAIIFFTNIDTSVFKTLIPQ